MPAQPNPPGFLARHAEARIVEALDDTRIVALVGPRQSGKTTLARKIAAARGMDFITLDDEQFRAFARDDPAGFMRGIDRAVIDEIQRAPGLILALKHAVDQDTRAGRFLVTGSVELFKSAVSPDSLAGRVETIELLPFSQSEIEGRPPSAFLTRAFDGDFSAGATLSGAPDLSTRILTGGYPESVARTDPARRQAWLRAYARALATRDIREIAEVHKADALARLLDHAAIASGQLLNLSALASPLGVDSKTVDRWLTLMEQLFIVRRVRAWHRNDLKRLVRAPKLHFLDTGLLAALRRTDVEELRSNRSRLGSLLEGLVFSELAKQPDVTAGEVLLSHYRDKDQVEVDIVLERSREIVGIEVKAAATVRPDDFNGLKRLRETTGASFRAGILLHDGERIQQVADQLFAMPIAQVWA